MVEDSVRVGVLSFHDSKESKPICNAVEELGHEPVWLRENNVLLRLTDGTFVLEPDVEVIVNRLLLSTTNQPVEAVAYATAEWFDEMLASPFRGHRKASNRCRRFALLRRYCALSRTRSYTSRIGRYRSR